MVNVTLSGWSHDRELSVVSKMLEDKQLPPVSGYFTGLGFVADVGSSATSLDAIASYFAPPTASQIAKKIEVEIDDHIDAAARADGWDSRVTFAVRAGYPNPWQVRAATFGKWMDDCYVKAHLIQADVVAGLRQPPTPEQVVAELPILVL